MPIDSTPEFADEAERHLLALAVDAAPSIDHLITRHLAAMVAAGEDVFARKTRTRRAPGRRQLWKRRAFVVAATSLALVVCTTGLAFANVLPAPAQHAVELAGSKVGIDTFTKRVEHRRAERAEKQAERAARRAERAERHAALEAALEPSSATDHARDGRTVSTAASGGRARPQHKPRNPNAANPAANHGSSASHNGGSNNQNASAHPAHPANGSQGHSTTPAPAHPVHPVHPEHPTQPPKPSHGH